MSRRLVDFLTISNFLNGSPATKIEAFLESALLYVLSRTLFGIHNILRIVSRTNMLMCYAPNVTQRRFVR